MRIKLQPTFAVIVMLLVGAPFLVGAAGRGEHATELRNSAELADLVSERFPDLEDAERAALLENLAESLEGRGVAPQALQLAVRSMNMHQLEQPQQLAAMIQERAQVMDMRLRRGETPATIAREAQHMAEGSELQAQVQVRVQAQKRTQQEPALGTHRQGTREPFGTPARDGSGGQRTQAGSSGQPRGQNAGAR